jgi:hypothetical protein
MGYISRQGYFKKCYVPSDDVIINNAATKDGLYDNPVYNKIKEIQLLADILAPSLFRFKFTLSGTGGTAYGKIYRNDAAIGTEQSWVGGIPLVKTEDIVSTNWVKGDTISLWGCIVGAPSITVQVSDFKVCGVGSEFGNTLGA